jgi:hypothetical protein
MCSVDGHPDSFKIKAVLAAAKEKLAMNAPSKAIIQGQSEGIVGF